MAVDVPLDQQAQLSKTLFAMEFAYVTTIVLIKHMPNIMTDLLILCMPIPLVLKLHITVSQKLALSLTFSLGAFVLGASIYRFTVLFLYDPKNATCLTHKTVETVRQVRDNQRRSRARRKELLEDMQRRLDEYERLGVQATLDMQQAARDVAQENKRLRALLAWKGVSDTELEEFLRVRDPVDNPSTQDRRTSEGVAGSTETVLRQTRFQSTLRVSSVTALLNAEQPPIPICSYHEELEPLSTASASNEERLFVMPDKDDTATSSADCLGPSNTTGSHQVNADLSRNLGMEMSCDVAATILANVQGQGDTSRARIDLGCAGRGVCAVKNFTVLGLLDEAG
ncbi:hypothetical protein SLS63_010339 [Diaporthe eres]|uniref:Rhodopsin domain-containing protein n=1 Tax=Diaporthe eres TaxID=83184 RepID=A0ABR1NX77_DIAER